VAFCGKQISIYFKLRNTNSLGVNEVFRIQLQGSSMTFLNKNVFREDRQMCTATSGEPTAYIIRVLIGDNTTICNISVRLHTPVGTLTASNLECLDHVLCEMLPTGTHPIQCHTFSVLNSANSAVP